MSDPPSTPDSPRTDEPAAVAGEEAGAPTPYLLVLPTGEDGPPTIAWPGPADAPAWAIPVTIPAGTRGVAVFVPVLPIGTPTGQVPVGVAPAQRGTDTAPKATSQPTDPPLSAPTTPSPAQPVTAAAPAPKPAPEAKPASQVVAASGAVPASGAKSSTDATPTSETKPASNADPAAEAKPASEAGQAKPAAAPDRPAPAAPAAPTQPTWPAAPAPGQPAPAGWAGGLGPAYFDFTPRTPPPSFLQTRWPGPADGRGWTVPGAVLASALGLAFLVPLTRTGIGWLLGWLVLTLGVVLAVRRAVAKLPRAERWVRAGWAVAALALLSVLAVRNAWWLVTFCVLGALGCATLAIVGGRLVRSILFSVVAAPFAGLRGLPWVRRHLHGAGGTSMTRRIVGSAAATVAVLVVFGGLLSSADVAFSAMLDVIVPEISVGTVIRWIFLGTVGGLAAVAAIYTLSAPPDLSTVDRPGRRRLGLLEWAPPIACLTVLFGGFVAVQFTVLFGGQRHVLNTTGLSYSEYARSGFWQLLAVTMLTLAVLGSVTRWARRERLVERVLLRVLLGLISGLAIVIVVSALFRMYTYQKVYSFTGERVFVMAFELLLGVVLLMILVAGIRWRGSWIPRLTVALTVAMLLSLAAINPDAFVARRNIARYEETGKIDAWYLRALSADATPALANLPDPIRRCTLSWIAEELDDPDPWYAWNLGRLRARQTLDRLGPGAIGDYDDCREADEYDLPKRTPR